MAKVAKLVMVSLMTRVIVEDNATDEQILEKAKSGFQAKLDNNELIENIESIEDDKECPIGTFDKDVYFQPDLEHVDVHREIMDGNLSSFDVFKSRELCKAIFPHAKIFEYSGDDIENPNFCDEDWEIN